MTSKGILHDDWKLQIMFWIHWISDPEKTTQFVVKWVFDRTLQSWMPSRANWRKENFHFPTWKIKKFTDQYGYFPTTPRNSVSSVVPQEEEISKPSAERNSLDYIYRDVVLWTSFLRERFLALKWKKLVCILKLKIT